MTPNTADRSSSRLVSAVLLAFSSETIEGKADSAVGPRQPFTRIVYKPGGVTICRWFTATW